MSPESEREERVAALNREWGGGGFGSVELSTLIQLCTPNHFIAHV